MSEIIDAKVAYTPPTSPNSFEELTPPIYGTLSSFFDAKPISVTLYNGRPSHTANDIRLLELFLNLFKETATIGKDNLSDRLKEIYSKFCVDDWDGEGAEAINTQTLKAAHDFINILPKRLPDPVIDPEPDGEISFEWYRGPLWTFSISVSQERILSYAGIFGNDSEIHGHENLGAEISETIQLLIDKLYGNDF